MYNRLAFYYSEYASTGGGEHMSEERAREKSIQVIDQALKLFTEVRKQLFPSILSGFFFQDNNI